MMRVYKHIVLMMALVLAAVGCERRTLLDPSFTTELNVMVNIDAVQNVTCDVYNPNIPLPNIKPEMLRVLFYEPGKNRVAGESYISSISTNADGNRVISGRVGVLPGE